MATLAPDHGICVVQRPTTLYPRLQLAFDKIISADTKRFISELKLFISGLNQISGNRAVTRCAKNILKLFLTGLQNNSEIGDEGLTEATVRSIALECVACFDFAQTLGGELPLAGALHLCCVASRYFRAKYLTAPVGLLRAGGRGRVRALSVFTGIFEPWRYLKMNLQLFAMEVNAQGGCTPAFVDNLTALGEAITATTDATAVAPLVDNLKRACFDAKSTKMYVWYRELTDLWLPRHFVDGSDRELDLITRGILNNLDLPHGAGTA